MSTPKNNDYDGKKDVEAIQRHMQRMFDDFDLSRRERELAVLVVQGHTNKRIGEQLFISEHTVKAHLKKIFHKVAVKNRGEFTAKLFALKSIGAER
ncbi:MAG: helix-turn-helix transcriptional regulator [Deltaproteobacteria bacterium]|nr:helix-turn-helix transcriptional regulator [Deltaproteobacteria bacterium]